MDPRRDLVVLGLASLAAGCGPGLDAPEPELEWEDGRTLTMAFAGPDRRRLDLIVVIDDSPSMRGQLETMGANAARFANVFVDESVPDIRVAFTTTSVAGPTCAGARAHGGEAQLGSCQAHLEDFVGPDEHGEHGGGVMDLTAVCTEQCSLASIEVVPSFGSRVGGSLAPRPWLDAPGGSMGSNLAAGVDYGEAVRCAMLQGFGGCSFESPIEAAARMVERMADPQDTMFGFRRPGAMLGVVIVSDEDDCSHPASSSTIFAAEGARVFWPEGAEQPLSAICVHAGVECDAQGCAGVDHDLDGAPTDAAEDAVLTPVSRLLDAFETIAESNPRFAPFVSIVGGYDIHGELEAAPAEPGDPDQDFAAVFGLRPGCTGGSPASPTRAAPGIRLAATTEHLYSICADDWTAALEPAAEKLIDLGQQPPCMPGLDRWACVEGEDPLDPTQIPDCVLESVAGEFRAALPLCERDAAGWRVDPDSQDYVVPAGANACWVYRGDAYSLTPDPNDDAGTCSEAEQRGQIQVRLTPEAVSSWPYDYYYALRCRPCR